MSNIEQRVQHLEEIHNIRPQTILEKLWGPEYMKREKVEDLAHCLHLFNNWEGLPYLDKPHSRKLAKKAIEFFEAAHGGVPRYSHKVCEELIETRKKLKEAEEIAVYRSKEITRLLNQVNKLAGEESGRNLNATQRVNELEDALRHANAEINHLRTELDNSQCQLSELEEWRNGKKGVEDYYKVQEENRKLREHFRYLGLDVPL